MRERRERGRVGEREIILSQHKSHPEVEREIQIKEEIQVQRQQVNGGRERQACGDVARQRESHTHTNTHIHYKGGRESF